MPKKKTITTIVLILVLLGGINWGLIGFLRYDLIAKIVGTMTFGARIIYALIGVATVYFCATSLALTKR